PLWKIRIPQRPFGFAGEQSPRLLFNDLLKRVKIIMHRELQPRPVIHGAAFEFAITQHEAEGTYEVQIGSRRDAQAGDVAGVGCDLRVHQNQLEMMRRKNRRPHGGTTSLPCASAWMKVPSSWQNA